MELVANADIVINAADADDLPLTIAILEGTKRYFEEHKDLKPVLVHISGVANFITPSNGSAVPNAKLWTVRKTLSRKSGGLIFCRIVMRTIS